MVDFSSKLTFLSNEISLVTRSAGVSHNGIFRGKDLGTISNLNEYIAFRAAHGIDDKSYTDLYLGDYFKIQDGTYNVEWIVAHFDYYYNKGQSGTVAPRYGVVLIPKSTIGITSKMKDTNDTTGGYLATIPHNTTCPAIANAISTVLGSYLQSFQILGTNTMNANIASMCGAGITGAATNWAWASTQCVLPNEIQIYGSTVCSSSHKDVGEANCKLAVFNFITSTEFNRTSFWLRAVANSSTFASVISDGTSDFSYGGATSLMPLRPLIYIG